MLVELRLQNLAVAEDVHLRLGSGLNVLTGSTGAGKSLVVEALRWIRGEKIDPGVLRSGAAEAAAEAVFDLSAASAAIARVRNHGVTISADGILRLRREWRDGRSRAWVDGGLTSAAVLTAVCDELVEVQSQHQQLALLDPRSHVRLLDDQPPLREIRERYVNAWRTHREHASLAEEARARHRSLQEESELLRYQWQELRDAGLEAGEGERLRGEVARLQGGADLARRVDEALAALEDEDNGGLALLQRAEARLAGCSEDIAPLVDARDDLASAVDLVDEARRRLESFQADLDLSPERLHEKHARLSELESLCRKYGRGEDELLALRDRLERDVESLDLGTDVSEELALALETSHRELEQVANELQRARKRQARRVERGASSLLGELGMEGAALRFEFEAWAQGGPELKLEGRKLVARAEGPMRTRLLVRTNPGESFGPVESSASGGELSRIGLVLRSLSGVGRAPCLLLLDEVDAGLGADLGPALARRLRALADGNQVLAITHLPAVAAAADVHLRAEKRSEGRRTATEVQRLDAATREAELIRMIGGPKGAARALARQLGRDTRGRAGAA